MKEIEKKLAEAVGKKDSYSLEDILVAIEDTKFSSGKFSIGYGIAKFMFSGKEMFNWQINTPYHEQSKDTKELIANLLK